MGMDFRLSSYYPVFVFVLVAVGFGVVTLLLAHLLGPRKRTSVKEMTYESGMDPIGTARQKVDVKYYLIAILFLVFDVELLFLYPWAVSAYEQRGGEAVMPGLLRGPVFWEVLVFLGTLVVAYVYAWRRGVFRWR